MSCEHVHGHVPRDRIDEVLRARGSAGANGVAKRYLIAAHVAQLPRHVCHGLRLDVAFVRAAEYDGNVAAHAHACVQRGFAYLRLALHGLCDRAVRVALRKSFRGRRKPRNFGGAGGDRRLQPLIFGTSTG